MTDKQKRDKAVKEFASDMIKKLDKKAKEGYRGWDNTDLRPVIRAGLIKHLTNYLVFDEPKQLVNIGNFAMMLHYQAKQRGLL